MNRIWTLHAVALVFLLDIDAMREARATEVPLQSTLQPGKGNDVIYEDELASMFSGALIHDGKPNVLSATFLFQECFGGGMLNAMEGAMGETVKWVGGSASEFDKPSYPNKENTVDAWTEALLPELDVNKDQTLMDAIDNAAANDERRKSDQRPNVPGELPQSASGNEGETIRLENPNATSYDAILWAGEDEPRHKTDIEKMKDALSQAWGSGANVNIVTITGNDATQENLSKKLGDLRLNNKEQFLFYATGHGRRLKLVPQPEEPISAGKTDSETFSLAAQELAPRCPGKPANPTLTVDYIATDTLTAMTDPVMLNDVLLGYLDPALTEVQLAFPRSVLALENVISITNNETTPDSLITISSAKLLDPGTVDTVDIAEPSSSYLVLLALFGLCLTRPTRSSGNGDGQRQPNGAA